MNTVQQQWAMFEKLVMPKDAPPRQRQEMRRAFYAGVKATLCLQFEMGNVSDDAVVAMIEGWHDECRRFAQQVAAGAA